VTDENTTPETDAGGTPSTGAAEERAQPAGETPQYGVGPFSVREVALVGVWLVAFIVSFFPVYGRIGDGVSVWTSGIDWVLTIAVPSVAVFLMVLRRLSPEGIRRVGSLGIDQFASVAFTVSMVVWLGILWNAFVTFAGSRIFVATWVAWVEFFLMLAGVVLTVFAPLIPTLNVDFHGRPESVAHRSARQIRPVSRRPAAPRRAPSAAPSAGPVAGSSEAADPAAAQFADTGVVADTSVIDRSEQVEPVQSVPSPAATQAFWALAPVERDIVDENGVPLFRIGPTAWALVIEDRGDVYVVRHEDGRVGYLTDVSGVMRG
jgi:hypothetical protein